MNPQEIEALAMTGAATIVAAMATDAWSTVRGRAVEFFRHARPDHADAIETQLDANAVWIAGADDAERARRALVGAWHLELEQLLAREPGAAGRLDGLIDEIQATLSAEQRQWVRNQQNNTVSGPGMLNAVQDGNLHIHFMDSPDPRGSAAQPPVEGDR